MARVLIVSIFLIGINLLAAPVQAPEQASWAVLDEAARSGDYNVRLNAVAALESMGREIPPAVDRMIGVLTKDKDGRVREAAALSLGRMKAEEAVPALKKALKDHNQVSFAAAQALMMIGDPAGREEVLAVLKGERSAEPGMMANAKRDAERHFRHPQEFAFMAFRGAVGAIMPPAAAGLEAARQTKALHADGGLDKVAAVDRVAADPDSYAPPILEWALGNSSARVRAEAAKSLGQRGNRETVSKLQPLLKDNHSAVRTMAAASIIRLSQPQEQRRRLTEETLQRRPLTQ